MHKEIKVVDKEKGIVRCTTMNERWYAIPSENNVTGLPDYQYVPSSTWIAGYYPKGIHYYKWLAEHGWDESQAIMKSKGNKGSKVHKACEILENQGSLSIETLFKNEDTEMMEGLEMEEIDCIMSFARWHDAVKPECLANEMTVFGEFYAGTLDRIYRIDGKVFIVDLKTSANIWTEHLLQISSYSHANIDYKKLGITETEWKERGVATLQLGYRLNKNRYKFTEQADKMDLFKVAYKIWQNENGESKPKEIEIPLVITIKKEK